MTLNYNDEIKIGDYGKPDFNFSENDLAVFDEVQTAMESYEQYLILNLQHETCF